ncbi:MAG: hypothetical protein AAGE92_04455, partial [Cyanobacteria bacterium P01_G01_bin.4]
MSDIAALYDAYALIDPPERSVRGYSHAARCKVIKFAPNDAKKHYHNIGRNIRKDGKLMLLSMPTLDEMLAMAPVLFTGKTAFRGQECADTEPEEQEVPFT